MGFMIWHLSATALWAANQFSACLAAEKDLQEWSSEIGSDVPFFFSHGAAYCTRRGEVVQDVSSPIPFDISLVLMKPPEACSTAEVYKVRSLNLDGEDFEEWSFSRCLRQRLNDLEEIWKPLHPSFIHTEALEPLAFEVLPYLRRLKQHIVSDFLQVEGNMKPFSCLEVPPQFVYDDEEYKVFLSEGNFITRAPNQWSRTSFSESLQLSEFS